MAEPADFVAYVLANNLGPEPLGADRTAAENILTDSGTWTDVMQVHRSGILLKQLFEYQKSLDLAGGEL